ncbi:MAG TPA: hypothetical protein VF434_12525 [Promineifilum sp.]
MNAKMSQGLSLQQRLERARRGRFVGRAAEKDLVQSSLASPELPFSVLFVFGPGGIGKSSLVREFHHIARDNGFAVARVDGRNLEPSPDSFLDALGASFELPPKADLHEFLADRPGRRVILVDTYELLTPLDGWIRDRFLPSLPGDVFVVLAGRKPPALPWRTDPGWQEMMRILPLRNLSPSESRGYLGLRGIPESQVGSILEFTHGHALALSLVADLYDQGLDTRFTVESAPNVIQILLEQLVEQVPSALQRATLEASALVRLTTESLLATLLGQADAHELFEWLRGLSFMETDPHGIYPHDLAREALTADLRWRNPDWFATLHERARGYYMKRVRSESGQDQQRLLSDFLYLHRDNRAIRPFFLWQETGNVFADAMKAEDVAWLTEMVRGHEGEGSAALAAHWFSRQPHNVSVLRGKENEPIGFLARVTLEATSDQDRSLDPAVGAAWNHLAHRPLRSGETATLFRFWMGAASYQSVSPEQSQLFLSMVQDYLVTPGLAFTFLPCAQPDFWRAMFDYADQERLPGADFTIGGRTFGTYGHDWRVTPPAAWLALMAEREMNLAPGAIRSNAVHEQLLVLSEADFAVAVRDALRDFTNPQALIANPLIRSRLVVKGGERDEDVTVRADILRKTVREAAESLRETPRLAKFYRAIFHTYFQPAMTQEQAAEIIDLPFSTYRRHLRSGIEEITSRLWAREIGYMEN